MMPAMTEYQQLLLIPLVSHNYYRSSILLKLGLNIERSIPTISFQLWRMPSEIH